MNRRQAVIALLAGAVSAHARAQSDAALSGDRFRRDGAEYQLADILAPSPFVLDAKAPPYLDEARNALAGILARGATDWRPVGSPSRWGVQPVRGKIGDDDVAMRLVALGAARVSPHSPDVAYIAELLLAEQEARAAARGLWALSFYRIRNANDDKDARTALDAFHLLEGAVSDAAKVSSRIYLNFGVDYKTDMTVTIAAGDWRRWFGRGAAPEMLVGRRLRVRGHVFWRNGPSIEPAQFQQLEFPDGAPAT